MFSPREYNIALYDDYDHLCWVNMNNNFYINDWERKNIPNCKLKTKLSKTTIALQPWWWSLFVINMLPTTILKAQFWYSNNRTWIVNTLANTCFYLYIYCRTRCVMHTYAYIILFRWQSTQLPTGLFHSVHTI